MSKDLVIKQKFENFSVKYFLNKRIKSVERPFGNSENLWEHSSLMFEVIRYRQINSRTSLYYRLYDKTKEDYMPYDNYFPVHEFEDVSKRFIYNNSNDGLWSLLIRREIQTIEAVMQITSDIPKDKFILLNLKEAHELAMLPFVQFLDRLLVEVYFNQTAYPELQLLSKLLKSSSYKIFDTGFLSYLKINLKGEHFNKLEQYVSDIEKLRNFYIETLENVFEYRTFPYITLPILYKRISKKELKAALLNKGFKGTSRLDSYFLKIFEEELEKYISQLKGLFTKD